MCTSPLWIKNRRYLGKGVPLSMNVEVKNAISLNPCDVARQYLLVPCGKCDECLQRQRNDWFVRLMNEYSSCIRRKEQVVFITITVNNDWYDLCMDSPSSFIRKFNETIRHRFGSSFKHFFTLEVGNNPRNGNPNRLHFHGFIFGFNRSYNELRDCVKKYGFIWLVGANSRRIRYCVKYVCKDIDVIGKDGKRLDYVATRKYRRKFVSPKVGYDFGSRVVPSYVNKVWNYFSFKNNINYKYTIPRYYDQFLSEKDKFLRSVSSAYSYSLVSRDPLVKYICSSFAKSLFHSSALSNKSKISRDIIFSNNLRKVKNYSGVYFPAWLTRCSDVLRYWYDEFGFLVPRDLFNIYFKKFNYNLVYG